MGRNNIGWPRAAFSFAMACVAAIVLAGCSQDTQATAPRPIIEDHYATGGNGEPYVCPALGLTFTKNANQQVQFGGTVVRVEFTDKTFRVTRDKSDFTMKTIIVGDNENNYVKSALTEDEKASNPLQIDASEFFTQEITTDTMQLLSGTEVTQLTICA